MKEGGSRRILIDSKGFVNQDSSIRVSFESFQDYLEVDNRYGYHISYFPKRYNPSVSRVENPSLCSAKHCVYTLQGSGVAFPGTGGARGSAKGRSTY